MATSPASLGTSLTVDIGQHLLGLGLAAYLGGFALNYAHRFAAGIMGRRKTSAAPLGWLQATGAVLAPIPAGLVWFWPRRNPPRQRQDHPPTIPPAIQS